MTIGCGALTGPGRAIETPRRDVPPDVSDGLTGNRVTPTASRRVHAMQGKRFTSREIICRRTEDDELPGYRLEQQRGEEHA